MAKFRNVSVKFWSDPFIESLTPEKKYFFLYLITNEHTTQCGIYEVTLRQMAFETGYNEETVKKLIKFFEDEGKIKYSEKTKEVAIKNFIKHNPQGSPTVRAFVEKELEHVKDRVLVAYLYGMVALSQEEEEEEETKEQEETKNPLRGQRPTVSNPFPVDSPEFKAWQEWVQFRKEKKQALTPSTVKKQIQFLGGRAGPEIVGIINQSITHGWTGLFDLKTNGNGKNNGRSTSGTLRRADAVITPAQDFGDF